MQIAHNKLRVAAMRAIQAHAKLRAPVSVGIKAETSGFLLGAAGIGSPARSSDAPVSETDSRPITGAPMDNVPVEAYVVIKVLTEARADAAAACSVAIYSADFVTVAPVESVVVVATSSYSIAKSTTTEPS